MHDRSHMMRTHRRDQPVAVVQIALHQRTPFHRAAVAARQAVIDDRPIAGGGKRLAGVAADITGTAGNEDRW